MQNLFARNVLSLYDILFSTLAKKKQRNNLKGKLYHKLKNMCRNFTVWHKVREILSTRRKKRLVSGLFSQLYFLFAAQQPIPYHYYHYCCSQLFKISITNGQPNQPLLYWIKKVFAGGKTFHLKRLAYVSSFRKSRKLFIHYQSVLAFCICAYLKEDVGMCLHIHI